LSEAGFAKSLPTWRGCALILKQCRHQSAIRRARGKGLEAGINSGLVAVHEKRDHKAVVRFLWNSSSFNIRGDSAREKGRETSGRNQPRDGVRVRERERERERVCVCV
jgi:hypothetical protein